ncbi:MAG: hypothetical protein AAGC86_03270 [Pseudomonadota bacterium]
MNDTVPRRLSRTVGQLALALLNATLILVVVALLLAWSLARTVERVTETAVSAATEQIAELSPLADDISGLQDQLREVRGQLADLRLAEDARVAEAAEDVLARLEVLEETASDVRSELAPAIEGLTTNPVAIIDRAVETGIAAAGAWVSSLSGCGDAPEGS